MSHPRSYLLLIVSLALLVGQAAGGEAPKAGGPKAPETDQQARTDRCGDPRPPGAVARLGTMRFRPGAAVPSLVRRTARC
jgi:hypothetical protein